MPKQLELEGKRFGSLIAKEYLGAALRKMFPACVVCGMTEEEHKARYGISLHVDHIRPLSDGNGLDVDNCVILCRSCNSSKGTKDLKDLPQSMRKKITQASKEFCESMGA